MRPVLAALALVVASVGALVFAEEPSVALAKCAWPGPNRSDLQQHYHDGWDRHTGATVGGVYARIRNQSPWVEPGTNFNGETRFSTAYSMIKRNRGEGYWAQVGWVEYAYDERKTYVQEKRPGVLPYTFQSTAKPVNSETYYTSLWSSTPVPGRFSWYVDGIQFGPGITAYWTPIGGEIAGEINIFSSQMPGGYNWPLYFFESSIYYSGAWRPFNGAWYTDNYSAFRFAILDQWIIAIWDSWCPD